jgi:DNA-binding transcriptional LysR family regulator
VNLARSAVSLHVKRLEEQVGSRLIVHKAPGAKLTEHGEIPLSYARRIAVLFKEAEYRLGRDSCGLVQVSNFFVEAAAEATIAAGIAV